MKTTKRTISFALAVIMLLLSINIFPVMSYAKEVKTQTDLVAEMAKSMELPTIYIKTANGRPVTNKNDHDASMRIELGSGFEEYVNYYTMENGAGITMKCRGNSSYSRDEIRASGKYSYKIKLDHKSDLFGLGASKSYALIANFFDVTNMRNKLIYDLAGSLGMSYNQSVWVKLNLNGKDMGLYSLVETVTIDPDSGRVDTIDWEEEAEDAAEAIARGKGLSDEAKTELSEYMENNLDWITSGRVSFSGDKAGRINVKVSDYYDTSHFDITSGYLIEYDNRFDSNTTKYYTEHRIPIQLDSPVALKTNEKMYSYLQELIADFEEAVFSDNFCTEDGRHWTEFVDVQAFVDFWLIFNFVKNIEFGYLSIFFYVDKGKIVFGPCWDFDNASGNQVTLKDEWMRSDTWFDNHSRGPWWVEIYSDPYFQELVRGRWFDIRESVEVYMKQIDIYDSYIEKDALANYEKYGAPQNWYLHRQSTVGYKEELDFFKNWMVERIDWFDEQFSQRDVNIDNRGTDPSEKIIFTVTGADGSALEADRVTAKGSPADYYYNMNKKETLDIKIETLHTSFVKVDILLNGKLISKDVPLTDDEAASIKLNLAEHGVKAGERATLHIVGYNSSNFYRASYITFNCTDVKNPSEEECSVLIGDRYAHIKIGSVITLPKITEKRDGFVATGWTDGEKTYPVGHKIKTNKNTRYYIVWEQTSVFEQFILEGTGTSGEDEIEPENPVTVVRNSDKIRYYGVQDKKNDNTLSLRFVSVTDSAAFDKVGYYLSIEYEKSGKKDASLESKTLYTTVYGADKTYTAEALGGKYVNVLSFDDISLSDRIVKVTVTPYAVSGNTVYEGDVYTVLYTGGELTSQIKK